LFCRRYRLRPLISRFFLRHSVTDSFLSSLRARVRNQNSSGARFGAGGRECRPRNIPRTSRN
jgi:hypothetical protein